MQDETLKDVAWSGLLFMTFITNRWSSESLPLGSKDACQFVKKLGSAESAFI